MKIALLAWMVILFATLAHADPLLTAAEYHERGLRRQISRQYQKAINDFGQAYDQAPKAVYLFHMAKSYEGLAGMPTKTVSEVLECKQQALGLYESALATAPTTNPEPWVEIARSRIGPLGQEVKALAERIEAEREEQSSRLKAIEEKLQLVIEFLRQGNGHPPQPRQILSHSQ